MSNTIKPKGAARTAVEAEATQESVERSFEYDGVTYTVESGAMDDALVMEAFETDKLVTAIKVIVGNAQWKMFTSKKRSFSKDFQEFASAVLEASKGVSSGESDG